MASAPRSHAGADSADAGASRRASVQSVARAFEILDVLKSASVPMSVLDVAKATGLDRTVVHRQLRTLAQCGMTEEEGGAFRLGSRCVLLANRYVDNLLVRRVSLPYLLEVQAGVIGDKPWSVTLSIPVGDVTTVVERIWTRFVPLGTVLDIGDTHLIDRGASGRAILAFQPPPQAKALIGAQRYKAVQTILARVRETGGVALSRGEAQPGVYAVAAAVRSRRGHPVASISVSGLDLGDQLADDSSLAGELLCSARAIGQCIS